MKSPFTHRKIIRSLGDFVGRHEILKWILNRLDNSIEEVDCISITGERRIGKSSLVYALTQKAIQEKYLSAYEDFIFIYFDLQRKALFPSPEHFFAEVTKQVDRVLGDMHTVGNSELEYREFDNYLQGLDLRDKKLILLFDEFENLCVPPFDIDFFNYLRSVVAQYKIGYITTSCEPLDSLCTSQKIQSSPFFNYFTSYNLELFKPAETRMLFKWGEDKSGVNFTDREKKAIIAVAGHHPFFLQIACNLVFIQKESGRFSKKRLADDFSREAESHFKYFINKGSKHERRAIYQIAHGNYAELHSYEKEVLLKRSLITITHRKPKLFSESFKEFAIEFLEAEMPDMDLNEGEAKIECVNDSSHYETLDTTPKCISMNDMKEVMKKVAKTDSTILITGETGVGKEYHARKIARLSEYKKPFVVCDCTQLSDQLFESTLFGHKKGAFTDAGENRIGLVETARGGTLFLDEIGELTSPLQAKLLRFIQDKSYRILGDNSDKTASVRIIAATNRNLEEMILEKTFRQDLYARLKVHVIHIPPLRERKDEISRIAGKLLKKILKEKKQSDRNKRISKELFEKIRDHDWPENVRGLENALKKAVERSKGRYLKEADIFS